MTVSPLPTIIVHGGAWAIPDNMTQACRSGVEAAVRAGYDILIAGGSSLDAVEAAIRVLEDDPVFDAGLGSCLNSAGEVETDAAVMIDWEEDDGPNSGAVAGIRAAKHPISVARKVMEETPHCLLVGEGGDKFVREIGGEVAEAGDLVTSSMEMEWHKFRRYEDAVGGLFNGVSSTLGGCDTVGAVALDDKGRMAAGTSTGGITGKRVGRVGDSPIVGAGVVCEKGVGGVSCTGHGESILNTGLARWVTMLMEVKGISGEEAVTKSLDRMKRKTGGCGGIILLDAHGEWVKKFTTERMAWAAISKNGEMQSGVERDD